MIGISISLKIANKWPYLSIMDKWFPQGYPFNSIQLCRLLLFVIETIISSVSSLHLINWCIIFLFPSVGIQSLTFLIHFFSIRDPQNSIFMNLHGIKSEKLLNFMKFEEIFLNICQSFKNVDFIIYLTFYGFSLNFKLPKFYDVVILLLLCW